MGPTALPPPTLAVTWPLEPTEVAVALELALALALMAVACDLLVATPFDPALVTTVVAAAEAALACFSCCWRCERRT